MKVAYTKSFEKTVEKIKDKAAIERLDELLTDLKKAQSLSEIPNVIPVENASGYFRIRAGNYRLIIERLKNGDVVILLIDYRRRNEKTYRFF